MDGAKPATDTSEHRESGAGRRASWLDRSWAVKSSGPVRIVNPGGSNSKEK
jgi:hypothetical protein